MALKSSITTILKKVHDESHRIFGDKLADIVLYGSYARGDYDQSSDVDIMLLIDMPQEELSQYRETISRLSSLLSLEGDVTVSIKLKNRNMVYRYKDMLPFYNNVLQEGVSINAGL